MERIYWIGQGLAKYVVVRRRKQVHLVDHDPEWKPVDEIKPWEYDEYEQGQARRLSAQEQRPDFEEAHEWLWPTQIRQEGTGARSWNVKTPTPHREFEATERGLKDLLNALCYNKGSKSVLAYSRMDMLDSKAFWPCAWGMVDIWITEVARMGGRVYFVKNVLKVKSKYDWSEDPEAKLDDEDKNSLAEEPRPETVLEYDAKYGRKITRRTR